MTGKVKKKCLHCHSFIEITPPKKAGTIKCPTCGKSIYASPSSSKKKNGVSFSKKLKELFS